MAHTLSSSGALQIPWRLTPRCVSRIPGGSSGGAAAAVAARICHLLRIPAASYARPVCRWKDLGPRLKTCQRGSLGDHGPVPGGGL